VRTVDNPGLTAIVGAGAGAMIGVSRPFGTAGGHLAMGGRDLRATVGVDWFVTRARIRAETLVQAGNFSTVERTESPHTLHGALLRVGLTFPVP
jgi:hypothetical protein